MTLKKTCFLAIFLIGLLSYLYFVQIPNEQQKKDAGQFLRGALAQEVEAIEIKNSTMKESNESVSVKRPTPSTLSKEERASLAEKRKGIDEAEVALFSIKDWEGVPVDGQTIQSYLTALTTLSLGEPLPKDEIDPALSTYGLDTPELSVKVRARGSDREIVIGKENSFLMKRYAKLVDADEIYMIPSYLLSSLDKKREDFRRKKLLFLKPHEVTGITFKKNSSIVSIASEGSGWKLTAPLKAKVGQQAITDLFREFNDLSATTLVAFGPEVDGSRYGLKEPLAAVEIIRKDKPTVTLTLQRKDPNTPESLSGDEPIYFSVSDFPLIAETSPNPISRLVPNVDALREKNQFQLPLSLITKVDVEQNGQPRFVLEKKGEIWNVGDKPADDVFVEDYLEKLSSLSAAGFPQEEQTIQTLSMKVTVSMSDNSSRVLLFGEELDGKRVAEADERFFVENKDFEGLIPRVDTFLAPPLPTPSPGE